MTKNKSTCLVTKTLIYNASIIFEDQKYFTLDRFWDFCALCEAVILFDKIITIESSNILPAFQLSKVLTDRDITAEFRPVSRSFQHFINSLPKFLSQFSIDTFWEKGIEPARKNLVTGDYDGHPYEHDYQIDDVRPMSSTFKYTRYNDKDNNVPYNKVLITVDEMADKSIVDLINSIDNWIDNLYKYESVPDEERASSRYILRSIGYLLVGIGNEISYFPDFVRIPFVLGYKERIYRSLAKELYDKIAEAFRTDIGTINKQTKSFTLPIPPFAALVLDRTQSLQYVPNILLDLRNEFSGFRSEVEQIDGAAKDADTIDEKMKAIRHKESLFKEISSSYENPNIISFKEGLDYTATLVKPVTKPTDPTSYSAAIIAQPISWLRRWWLRRPISPLFRVDNKIRNIHTYDKLIDKLWGIKIQESVIDRFKKHGEAIDAMFKQA